MPTWELLQTLLDCVYLGLCPLLLDVPVSSLGDPPHRVFSKMELLELEVVMVCRVTK